MRELSMAERWPKLAKPIFTTFRFIRRDRDWGIGEVVKVVYNLRSKEWVALGVAKIIGREPRRLTIFCADTDAPLVSMEEAIEDGFESLEDMVRWMVKVYGWEAEIKKINKLTLRWGRKP